MVTKLCVRDIFDLGSFFLSGSVVSRGSAHFSRGAHQEVQWNADCGDAIIWVAALVCMLAWQRRTVKLVDESLGDKLKVVSSSLLLPPILSSFQWFAVSSCE